MVEAKFRCHCGKEGKMKLNYKGDSGIWECNCGCTYAARYQEDQQRNAYAEMKRMESCERESRREDGWF